MPQPGQWLRSRRRGQARYAGMKKPLHSDKQTLCKSDAIAAFVPFVRILALSGAVRQLSQGESRINCISQSPKAPTRQRRMGAFDY